MGQTVNLLRHRFGGSNPSLPTMIAEVAQLIEHQPSKLRVASLSLVFRSKTNKERLCSSGVERILGKDEVAGSIPAIGSREHISRPSLLFDCLMKVVDGGEVKCVINWNNFLTI